jgi:hypothetical protein
MKEAMRVEASAAATRTIREQGGRLYIWFEDAGRAWLRQRVATRPPDPPIEFSRYDATDFSVFLPLGVDPPPGIFVGLSPWPLRRLEVAGFGADRDESASPGP